jgi:hypothetical protein
MGSGCSAQESFKTDGANSWTPANCQEAKPWQDILFFNLATTPLLVEVLGPINPIVASSLVKERLQLQATCQEACRCVQRFSEETSRLAQTRPEFVPELVSAEGDIELIWACVVASEALRIRFCHTGINGSSCPPVLFAFAGRHRHLVRLLRAHGAEVPEMPKKIPSDDALQAASHGNVATVLRLLSCGLNINGGYTFGWTMLMSAAGADQEWMVKVLLALGANVHTVDSVGKYARDVAERSGHSRIVGILDAHAERHPKL